MQLKVITDFSWAHRHVEIREHKVGEIIETDDHDLIEVSIREGWTVDAAEAVAPDVGQAPVAKPGKQAKAAAKSPEVAAEAGAPEVKAD